MSENNSKTMILQMLAEGKITVEESERLLNAVNNENNSREKSSDNGNQQSSNSSFPNIPFLEATKIGLNLRNMVQTVHDTVQKTIKQVEPRSKDLKEKMREFGGWMEEVVETMASEITNHNGLPADSMSVDFIVPAPKGTENCKSFIIENIYGEIHINEGPEFKLLVNGQISKNTLGELQSSEWFSNNAIKIVDDKMHIGFDSNTQIKALIDINITLPTGSNVVCKTINSAIKTTGMINIDAVKTVSGNVRIDASKLENTKIESVSGVIQIVNVKNINANINTTSGDLLISNSSLNKITINTVNGDLIIHDSEIVIETEIEAITTSGDITIEKLTGPWKNIDANSRNGQVFVEWRGNPSPLNKQRVNITTGGEGAKLYADSVSGNVKFRC